MTTKFDSKPDNRTSNLICHLAFWFGLTFASPVFIALHNIDGIGLEPGKIALFSAMACFLSGLFSWSATFMLRPRARTRVAALFVSLAILIAIQGNWIHELHGFGVFDGRPVDFRENGALFWLEWAAWLSLGAGLFWLISRMERIPTWLPALPVLSFCLLLAPALFNPPQEGLEVSADVTVDPSVYAFSSIANLIHLLPDGFQGDTVREAFEIDPDLAARFEGFTLFTDHLGRYPGTASSLYTMLTGQPFPLERGFSYSWVGPETRELSYQAELARHGYQVDLVPISSYICPENAASCHPKVFKNTGFKQKRDNTLPHSLRLLADMTLFRLSPLYLKEKIYAEGYWLLSDIGADESSPIPDPILHDWAANMHVVDDRPVYKWYHYIGTHVPPRWDASCDLKRKLEPLTENYLAQTHCVLTGIANLIDRLKTEGIYDQTSIIISGDHGHNTVPLDQVSIPLNYGMYEPLLGTGRPALLIKAAGAKGPLGLSKKPTHMLNIMPTALALAGLPYDGQSVFDVPDNGVLPRIFQHYPIGPFWSGDPVPYVEYEVGQPANDAALWKIRNMVTHGPVPAAFLPVNKKTAKGFAHGARLRSSFGQNKSSWIQGRQLAISIDIPESPMGGKLLMEIAIEPWMSRQSFTVTVNGGQEWKSGPISGADRNGKWKTWTIPVRSGYLKHGPDFVSVLFENVYARPGSNDEFASARIRELKFVRAD